MTSRQLRNQALGIATGLAATLVVLICHVAGKLDWIEWKTLDLRFQLANSIPQSPLITMVDIDDASLRNVGRWPWPRDVQAGIIREIAALGAIELIVDINWVEPETVRTVPPDDVDLALDDAASAESDLLTARPDDELAEALRRVRTNTAVLYDERADASDPAESPMRRRVRDWLTSRSAPPDSSNQWLRPLLKDVTGLDPRNATTERAQAIQAVREELSLRATERLFLPWLDRVASIARPVRSITPTYYKIAASAYSSGFVVFEPDNDKVVRRQSVFVRYRDLVIPQLAVRAAIDHFRVQPHELHAAPLRFSIRQSAHALDVQLDANGRMIIPWVAGDDYTSQFDHLPADALWQAYDRRQKWAQNQHVIRETWRSVLDASGEHSPDYAETLNSAYEADDRFIRLVSSPGFDPREPDRKLDEFHAAALHRLRTRRSALATQPYHSVESDLDRIDQWLAALDGLAPYHAANRALEREIDDIGRRIRPKIEHRFCFLGYTATALADMTPTPTHKRVPGVMAHANVLNGFLTGRTVSWLRTFPTLAISGLLGALATLLAVRRRPREGVPLILAASALFVAVAVFCFYHWTFWLPVTPVVGAMATSFVAVSLYQYAFIDRERRQLASALGQYTSKEIARQMAENPDLCKRAETREVTTVFTDLRGFTQISERIGADRTQKVLNVCLGRFTNVLLRHEAMINKFIGDGIFAFWNPVIFPQADHAFRACEAAIDMIADLQALVRDAQGGADETFRELELRVGIATGNAVVGPCGSEQKYDYTCIGDSVNVSSRLESANKFFGTNILVSGSTRNAVGDRFIFRPLGGVRVKGKRTAVPVFELLGRAGHVSQADMDYSTLFGRGVECFQRRDWLNAAQCFSECLKRRECDLAAAAYSEITIRYQFKPPPDDWLGAIELTEK